MVVGYGLTLIHLNIIFNILYKTYNRDNSNSSINLRIITSPLLLSLMDLYISIYNII